MRAIHTIALLPVITVLCWGQEESAPKNELAFGLGGLPSLSRSDAPSLNAGPGRDGFFERHVSHSKLRQSLCHQETLDGTTRHTLHIRLQGAEKGELQV